MYVVADSAGVHALNSSAARSFHLKAVPFSSLYGTGLDELYDALKEKRQEFFKEFLPEIEKVRKNVEKLKKNQIKTDMEMPSDIVYNGMHEKDEVAPSTTLADKNIEQKKEERLEESFKNYLNLNASSSKPK